MKSHQKMTSGLIRSKKTYLVRRGWLKEDIDDWFGPDGSGLTSYEFSQLVIAKARATEVKPGYRKKYTQAIKEFLGKA